MAQLLRYRAEGSSRKHRQTHAQKQIIKLFSGSLFFTAFVGTRHATTAATTTTTGGAAVSTRNRNRNRFKDPSGATDLFLPLSLSLALIERPATCPVSAVIVSCMRRRRRGSKVVQLVWAMPAATARRVWGAVWAPKSAKTGDDPLENISVIRFALHKVHYLIATPPTTAPPPCPRTH